MTPWTKLGSHRNTEDRCAATGRYFGGPGLLVAVGGEVGRRLGVALPDGLTNVALLFHG